MSATSSALAPVTIISTPEGEVEITTLGESRRRVTLKPNSPDQFIPRLQYETSLPEEYIRILLAHSFPWLCDTLARHDDPDYVQKILHAQLNAYFHPNEFPGKRILDFGCGSGASSMIMGKLFPETEVVGVELDHKLVDLANQLRIIRNLKNVSFLASPAPDKLPEDIGQFDFIMLSAVYEHMLPNERKTLIPLLWRYLKNMGALLINQTPYRYFPKEHHTTGLWFINYLPRPMAHWFANHFAVINTDVNRSTDWNVLLRAGIRGGTEGEVLRNIRLAKDGKASVMRPRAMDRADYWLSLTHPTRNRVMKKGISKVFRLFDRAFGTIPGTHLDVVIQKQL